MASQAEIDLIVNATNTLSDLQRDISRIASIAEATAPTINIPVEVDRDGALRRLSSSLGPAIGALGNLGLGVAKVGAVAGTAAPLIAGVAAAAQSILPAAALATQGMLAMQLVSGTLKLGMIGVSEAVSTAFDPEATPAELAEAMSKLAPEAQRFVKELSSMRDGFKSLQLGVQDTFFNGLADNLKDLGTSVLPDVRTALFQTAASLNAMARGAATAATDLGKSGTLGRALESTTDGLANLVEIPGQAVTAFGQLAAAAGPSFERVTSAVADVATKASASLSGAFKSGALEDAIDAAVDAIAQLGRIAGNVFGALGNVIGAASTSGAGLFDTLETITQSLEDATGTKEFQTAISELSKTMGLLATTAGPILVQAISIVAEVLTELAAPARELIVVLGDSLSRILDALSPVLVTLAGAFGELVVALLPLVELAADLIVATLPALVPLFETLGTVIEAAAPFITQLASNLGVQLIPLLESLTPVLEQILPPLAEMAQELFPILTDLLVDLAPFLADIAVKFADLAVQLAPVIAALIELQTAIAAELLPILGGALKFVIIGIITVFSALADIMTGFVLPALRSISDFLSGDFSGAARNAKEVYENMRRSLVDGFGNLVINVGAHLRTLVSDLHQKAGEGALRFGEGIARLAANSVRIVAALPGQIRGALGNLGSLLFSAGADIINGLIAGIRSKIGGIIAAASDAANAVTSRIAGLLGINSPSIVLHNMGEDTGQGYINGFESMIPDLRKATSDFALTVPTTVQQTVSPLGQRFNVASPGSPAVYVSIGNEAIDQFVTTRVESIDRRRTRVAAQGVRR